MLFTTWRRWLNRLALSSQASRRQARPKPARRLQLEGLEQRVVPATRMWSGLGPDSLWATAKNWVGNIAPLPMDDLVFPAGAYQLSNSNNFAPNTFFKSITLHGGGYFLTGNPIGLGIPNLGGGIADDSGAVTNLIGLSIGFPGMSGTETINISSNTVLTILGQFSGPAGIQIRKINNGTVAFAGDDSGFFGSINVGAGALQVQNANALGTGNSTTVNIGAALQVKDVTGTINEAISLSGTGIQGGGALENVHGFNSISGTITLVRSTTIGADAGILTLSGTVQSPIVNDLTIGGNSTEDAGKVAFTNSNTYLGTTFVSHGALNIQAPQALGPITKSNGVLVGPEGALELQLNSATVVGQRLTLNGAGINNTGALRNISGNNIWDGNLILQSSSSIGADTGSTLTIGDPSSQAGQGVISESGASAALTKEGNGELILIRNNTYSGLTTVDQGILTARNSFALGGGGNTHSHGARVIGQATLQLNVDPTTGNSLTINEPLELNGPGSNRLGALNSAGGANTWQGIISLATDASVGAGQGSTLYLGDPASGAGTVQGTGGLTKEGFGTVVLPNANSYLGSTDVDTGVLEVQDNNSLGGIPPAFAVQDQAGTTVNSGAALWVAGVRQRDQQGGVTITEPLTLAGTGLNGTGALFNLNGTNLLSGDITLTGDTNIGVSAGPGAPNGSELSLTGDISESGASRGLKKVGAGRLIVSGYNLYSGLTEVAQGALTVAGSNALGTTGRGTQVDLRGALELKGGVQVLNEALTLNGSGINGNGALCSVSDDNRWTGNVTFNSNVAIGVGVNSRLTMRGNLGDGNHGFNLTKAGAGELVLGGINTYGGGTLIQAGIVNIQSSAALANPVVAGTRVQDGAALELQAGVTVGSQKLTVAGNGPGTALALPGGGEWFPVGPAAVTGGSTGVAKAKTAVVSGRVTGIAADPRDPNLIYIATASGGVWRTKNGGLTWVPLTDNLPTLFTNAIAIAPSDPNTIYVGTGNPDWNTNNFSQSTFNSQFYGRGILKSTDGGATWTLLTGNPGLDEFDRQEIERIVIDPSDPNFVYVATAEQAVNGLQSGQSGVWTTTDGGASWSNSTALQILPPGISSTNSAFTDLAFDPATLVAPFDKFTRHLFAAIGTPSGDPANGLWESFDSGSSWTLNPGFPAAVADGVIRLAISPNPKTPVIYASLSKADGTLASVQVSNDDGLTWSAVAKAPPDPLAGQAYYTSVIAEDPRRPNTLYLGGTSNNGGADFLQTTDGGATWIQIDLGADLNAPHTNHHALAFDASGRLLDGSDGGIWRLDVPVASPINLIHWTDLNSNLQITQLEGAAINPQNANIIYVGSTGNGFDEFTGAQSSGALGWKQLLGADNGAVGIDFNSPATVYHAFAFPHPGFFQRSDNGGQTFANKTKGINIFISPTPDNANYYVPFVVDPARTTRLVLGTDRIYESINRGDQWTSLSTPGLNGWNSTAPIDAVAVAPSDPNVIYAAAGSNLFVTFSHGRSSGGQQGWSEVDIGPVGRISQIWVDPEDAGTAYAVRSTFDTTAFVGRVFKTVNGGQTWQDISGNLPNLPVWSILLDSRPNQHVLYVGTDAGVYSTTDLGQGTFQWQQFGTGLPNTQVRQILLDPLRDYLAVATHGRGLWEIELDPAQANAGAIRGITGANTWSGTITLAPNGRSTVPNVTVGADFGASVTISGILGDAASGTGLTKTGAGTVRLLIANTYGGPTVVNQGILNVQDPQALGTNRNVTVNNGGSLELEGDAMNFAQHLTLTGPGSTLFPDTGHEGALVNVSGSNTWSGNVTLGGDSSVAATGNSQLTVTGVIDDNSKGVSRGFSILKDGQGEIVFTNSNSYSGNTTVAAGDLSVQNVRALGTGRGTAFVLNNAALFLQFPVSAAGNPVPLGQKIIPANVMTPETLHLSGTGLSGAGALRNVSGNNAWAGTIVLDGSAAIGVDDDLSGLTADGGSPLTLTGVINDGTLGPASLTKVGLGTLVLTRDNFYSGGTEVAQGVLNIQSAQALGSTLVGFVTQVDDQAALELQFIDPAPGLPTTINGEFLSLTGVGINGGGALRNVSGNNVWTGTINLTGASAIGIGDDPNNSTPLNLTVTGDISGSLANDLDKVGPGTLILPSANDYSGNTSVLQGTLLISDANALGAGDSVFVGDGGTLQLATGSNGPITVSGQSLQLNGAGADGNGALQNVSGSNTWNGQILLDGNTTVNVLDPNDTLTTGNSISGGGSLTKIGPGTLFFSAGTDNSYSGLTTVAEGTLLVDGTILGDVLETGGTVAGTGTVLGGVTLGGGSGLAPGDPAGTGNPAIGILAINANVNMATGSTYGVQFMGQGGSSSLLVNGYMNLDSDGLGGATLTGAVAPGFTCAVGASFAIIQTTGTLTGTFDGIANGDTITLGGLQFQVTYTSHSVVLTRV